MNLAALLNVNTIIIAVILTVGLYGLVAGKQRLRLLILSAYVGVVLAEQFASLVAPRVPALSTAQISWLLLGLPILIFGLLSGGHGKGHAKGSAIANMLVGVVTGGFIVSSALHLLPPSDMAGLNDSSFIATNLVSFHLWLLGLLPIVALILGFMSSEKKAH